MELLAVWLLAAALALAAVVLSAATKATMSCASMLPPGPRGLPVVGNLLELLVRPPHRAMARLSEKYGPIVSLRLGAAHTILVSSPTVARACLSGPNDKIFASRRPMEIPRRLSFGQSQGIFMAPYGDEWRHLRKLCSLQLFTTKRVKGFEPVRSRGVQALLRQLELQQGQPINLTEAIARMIEDTSSNMLLGKPLTEIGNAEVGNLKTLLHRLTVLIQTPMIGDFIPALSFLDWKTKAALDEVAPRLHALVSNMVSERQQLSPGSPPVIIDILLERLDADKAKTIIAELITSSIDTLSATLDWAIAELVGSPPTMKRLQAELDQLTKGDKRMIDEEELGSLVYLKAVLKETLRLHPPGPLLAPHFSTEECEVEGYRIPKASILLVNAWAIGRDPQIWNEPDRFLPERFLTEKGAPLDVCGKHFELLPFGSGRRTCPGMPLALPLLYSSLANLIHTFQWNLPPNHDVPNLTERFGLAISRAHPLLVIPHLRHQE